MHSAKLVMLLSGCEIVSSTIYDGPDFFSLLEYMRDAQEDIEYRIGVACWIVGETINEPRFDVFTGPVEQPLVKW